MSELSATILTCADLIQIGQKSALKVDELIDLSEDLEQISVIMYTSGSTGMPKGVCLKRLNIMGAMKMADSVMGPYLKTKNPVLYDFLPTAHIMGRITE